MDLDKPWTEFTMESEFDHYGMCRMACAYNELRKELTEIKKLLKEGFDLIDDGMPLIHESMQYEWIGVESWRGRVEELELEEVTE